MTLKAQILFFFIGITILTVSASGILFYYSSKNTVLNEIYEHLESVSQAKADRLKGIIQNRKDITALLQNREAIPASLYNFLLTGSESHRKSLITSAEIAKNNVEILKDIHILDLKGEVIASTNAEVIGEDFSDNETFIRSLRGGRRAMKSFYYDEHKRLVFHIGGGIPYNGRQIGVVMAETFSDDILSVIMDHTGLGDTGETTLMQEDENRDAIYITPTRHFPVPGLLIRLERKESYVSFKALDGHEGLFIGLLDYRDKQVIAVARNIAGLNWGLTTKIDMEEAYAPIVRLRSNIILTGLILILITFLLAYYFANKILIPLKTISMAALKIGEGDYAQKVEYYGKNEIGHLVKTINLMAENLQGSQAALDQKVEELNSSNENLQRFSYVVSHDLKSPLNNFLGLLDMLRKRYLDKNDSKFAEMIGMLTDKANQMKGLIEGILHYSMAGLEKEKEQVDLNTIVENVKELVFIPENIELKVDRLPTVNFPRVGILQVFQNLVSNSVKYMDKDEGFIHIGYQEEEKCFIIHVADNGQGIEKKDFPKIFEVFNKVGRQSTGDSTGVGLSIVKKIIENNGGKIWVESEPGKGTTFYFSIDKLNK